MNKPVQFKKIRHQPYPKDKPIVRQAMGEITLENNLKFNNSSKKESSFVVRIWDKESNWYDGSYGIKLDTLTIAKKWLEDEFGGKWKFWQDEDPLLDKETLVELQEIIEETPKEVIPKKLKLDNTNFALHNEITPEKAVAWLEETFGSVWTFQEKQKLREESEEKQKEKKSEKINETKAEDKKKIEKSSEIPLISECKTIITLPCSLDTIVYQNNPPFTEPMEFQVRLSNLEVFINGWNKTIFFTKEEAKKNKRRGKNPNK